LLIIIATGIILQEPFHQLVLDPGRGTHYVDTAQVIDIDNNGIYPRSLPDSPGHPGRILGSQDNITLKGGHGPGHIVDEGHLPASYIIEQALFPGYFSQGAQGCPQENPPGADFIDGQLHPGRGGQTAMPGWKAAEKAGQGPGL